MLTITATNIGGSKNICDYRVRILVNNRVIFETIVEGHDRELGWPSLVHAIGRAGTKEGH